MAARAEFGYFSNTMKVLRGVGLAIGTLILALVVVFAGARSIRAQDARPAVSGTAPPPSAEPRAAPPSDAAAAPPAPGQAPLPKPSRFQPREPGADLTVTILTFSPGDHPFYKFGHNAIWIHDSGPFATRDGQQWGIRDRVYNYGTFAFGDPALIPKFFLGRFMYWLSIDSIERTKFAYRQEGRAIYAQELDLSNAQKAELQRLLEENARLENRYYKYNYYTDNCATRVRDMIDRVLSTDAEGHGDLYRASQEPARMTYRDHTLRLTESLPAEEVVLNLVMGDYIDKPIKVWDEAFIPMELQKSLRTVKITGEDGQPKPLVRREYTLVPSLQTPPAEKPPTWWPYALVSGLLAGGFMAVLGWLAGKNIVARGVYGAFLTLFGFVIGFLGIFFLAAWAMTDHQVGYHNENTMLCAPWAIALTGTGVRVMLGGKHRKWLALGFRLAVVALALYVWNLVTFGAGMAVLVLFGLASVGFSTDLRVEEKLVYAAAALTGIATIVKILPWFDQKNGFFIVFFLPFWLGMAWGIHRLRLDLEAKAGAERAKENAQRAALVKKADEKALDEADVPARKSKKKGAKKRPAGTAAKAASAAETTSASASEETADAVADAGDASDERELGKRGAERAKETSKASDAEHVADVSSEPESAG